MDNILYCKIKKSKKREIKNIVNIINIVDELEIKDIRNICNVKIKLLNIVENNKLIYNIINAYFNLKKIKKFILKSNWVLNLIPEVGMQIVGSYCKEKKYFLAFEGRIRKGVDRIIIGQIRLYASNVLSSILDIVKKSNITHINYVINIRYDIIYINLFEREGYIIKKINRNKDIIQLCENTLPNQITNLQLQSNPCLPIIIYDEGSIGLEPMIRILCNNIQEIKNIFYLCHLK